jgi:hypothetical protein
MTHTKPQAYPAPKSPSDKTDVQKTWRAHGWKPSKKIPSRGTGPTYAQEGRTT